MAFNIKRETILRIYNIGGCYVILIVYAVIFGQILYFYNTKTAPNSNLDFRLETYEIDQKMPICFKDIVPFNMLLKQESEVCRNNPEFLITIHTEPDNFQLRNLFRSEFTARIKKTALKYNLRLDVVFVLGLDESRCILPDMLHEMSTHNDILLGGFVDTYYNQTVKSITLLKWFVNHCKETKLLMKLSDIVNPYKSLNTEEFYDLIQILKTKEKVLTGSMRTSKMAVKRMRIPWLSSVPYLYPGLPQHLHLNYLLSRDTIVSLLKANTNAVYISLWKEDLYVTGVLADIAKIKIEHNENFLTECEDSICTFCNCSNIELLTKVDTKVTKAINLLTNVNRESLIATSTSIDSKIDFTTPITDKLTTLMDTKSTSTEVFSYATEIYDATIINTETLTNSTLFTETESLMLTTDATTESDSTLVTESLTTTYAATESDSTLFKESLITIDDITDSDFSYSTTNVSPQFDSTLSTSRPIKSRTTIDVKM